MEPRRPESSTPTSFRGWCEDVFKPALLSEAPPLPVATVLQD